MINEGRICFADRNWKNPRKLLLLQVLRLLELPKIAHAAPFSTLSLYSLHTAPYAKHRSYSNEQIQTTSVTTSRKLTMKKRSLVDSIVQDFQNTLQILTDLPSTPTHKICTQPYTNSFSSHKHRHVVSEFL